MSNNSLVKEAKIIASNKFLVKKYTTPTEISTNQSFRDRLFLAFSKLHYRAFNVFYSNRPWTSPASILFFDKVLNKNMVGLEYGSGRSTMYFAKKLKKLISIEHYEDWFYKVQNQIKDNQINNVDYFFIPKENHESIKEDLDIYMNEHNNYESKKNYKNYYDKVNEYPNDFFDFILIDGRARVRCGLNAKEKLKKGGIFVLDNSERERYQPLMDALKLWPMINTTNGFTNTTIWIKP